MFDHPWLNKSFLAPSANLPRRSFEPIPHVQWLGTREESSALSLRLGKLSGAPRCPLRGAGAVGAPCRVRRGRAVLTGQLPRLRAAPASHGAPGAAPVPPPVPPPRTERCRIPGLPVPRLRDPPG